MLEQDKELLLTDLCSRMPYGVKGFISYDVKKTIFTVIGKFKTMLYLSDSENCNVEDFVPYLRPISSMTEEEKKVYYSTFKDVQFSNNGYVKSESSLTYDFLNAHHFDYRGLIEKGLALEAKYRTYKFE